MARERIQESGAGRGVLRVVQGGRCSAHADLFALIMQDQAGVAYDTSILGSVLMAWTLKKDFSTVHIGILTGTNIMLLFTLPPPGRTGRP